MLLVEADACNLPINIFMIHGVRLGRSPEQSIPLYSFVPPLASAVVFQIRRARPISLDCHQPYIVIIAKAVCLAARTFWQSAFLRSVVIFINIIRLPPVRYCQISSAVVETAFWRPQRRRSQEREEEAYAFNLIILANQGDSPGQPERSLRAATAVRYNYYVQLVAIERDWMRVPNLKYRSARQRGGWKHKAVHIQSLVKSIRPSAFFRQPTLLNYYIITT